MAEKRDYYDVLGVQKGASADEIKAAYRKTALKWHPDRWVSGSDAEKKTAEDKFKEASEAYSVLSDPDKKAKYDQFGFAGVDGGAGGFDFNAQGFGGFTDLFNNLFGGAFSGFSSGRSSYGSRAQKGRDIQVVVRLTLEEIARGCTKEVSVDRSRVCHVCGGVGAKNSSDVKTCPTCQGRGTVARQSFIFTTEETCPNCRGTGKIVTKPCSNCRGTGLERVRERVNVSIPAGVAAGMKLPVQGQGDGSPSGGPNGDLYIVIDEVPHNQLRRDGENLFYTRVINLIDALTGVEIDIPCIDGVQKLKLAPGVQSGTVERLRGKGLPSVNGYGKGDLYVKILVWLPHKLNKEERAAIEAMRGSDSFKPNPSREDREVFEKEMKFF